jgi:hypothetical protein
MADTRTVAEQLRADSNRANRFKPAFLRVLHELKIASEEGRYEITYVSDANTTMNDMKAMATWLMAEGLHVKIDERFEQPASRENTRFSAQIWWAPGFTPINEHRSGVYS